MTSLQMKLDKLPPGKLRGMFPNQDKKRAIHLVLCVAAADDKPPQNLMKVIRETTRSKYRGKIIIKCLVLPAHFHDVDGDLSDHNVREMFGLSKILTMIL